MITDNPVLVRKHETLPTIMCVQRKAKKMIPTEADIIRANIASFGNEIGQVTNRTTSMYDVRSHYPKGSKEYETLTYRIRCGQLIQQNCIDKAKGIVAKPMPKNWYDRHAVGKIEDDEEREFYRSIVADRKPYFMRYIYPDLKRQYRNYIKNTDKAAMRNFNMHVSEMKKIPFGELTEQQKYFLQNYERQMPVGTGDCVMNRICRKIENEFDGIAGSAAENSEFDYSIMKSGAEYGRDVLSSLKRLRDSYNQKLREYKCFASIERVDAETTEQNLDTLERTFFRDCMNVCSNYDVLCDALLDICYQKSGTKRFVWDMCGRKILKNLLNKNGNKLSYMTKDPDGDVEYRGERFKLAEVEVSYGNYFE